MVEQRPQRQLSAILAADVAGYSRLIGLDEEGTLARLKELRRSLLDPKINEHRGRIVKTMGDGLLVQFASAVDAVRCAVDMQRQMSEQDADTSEDQRIKFRIGINLGDVVVDGDDIHGDGVNIAARLEALARPGGICISHSVHEQVRDKVDVGFADTGEQQLKNISRSVRVYEAKTWTPLEQPAKRRLDKPSVAVLPFDNMSGDPEQEYFSSGITEDIIAELSRFRHLLVIARNSSFAFKGQALDLREVGRRLGVGFLVEGSVRRSGNRVRITAQLIDAESGNHLWTERFDRELQDIFAIQDEVTAGIVGKVAGQVQAAGIERVRRRTGNLAAYDYYLKGKERAVADDLLQALDLLERAIAEDANFAQAHALRSDVQLDLGVRLVGRGRRTESDAYLEQALKSAQRAVTLDSNDARCHAALGLVYFVRKQFDLAAYHTGVGRKLNPNDPDVIALACYLHAFGTRPQEALDLLELARRLSPILPDWYLEPWGVALYALGRYSEAVGVFERSLSKPAYIYRYLAACYAQIGDLANAKAAASEFIRLQPEFSCKEWAESAFYKSETTLLDMLEGLRKAGLPG